MAERKDLVVHMGDATKSGQDLASICFRTIPVIAIADLKVGEATLVFDTATTGLLLSDTARARRSDGTWVLFVKGMPEDLGASGGSLDELCGRGIYRSTSSDLIAWTEPEKVVGMASVPEAAVGADGNVWLYWQDFTEACEAQNQPMAARAAISGAYELASGDMSNPIQVSFPDESFETNSTEHYATNGNPVELPDAAARAAFEACMQQ